MKRLLWPGVGTALALLLFGVPRRRRYWPTMLVALVLSIATVAIGCGSSSSKGGSGNAGTSAGIYTVAVSGTSGSITGTLDTVTLNQTVCVSFPILAVAGMQNG
ncbi:hypothetical protein ACFPT7_17860 [Acidicapsa dinghuensis]|uniref:Uncharacterized protein n=1 Tax=Acidicapsa dinghuensis TaxID=2218256 RepID=A0ABW1ELM0_9BACT|nr:hypothetical protein [Acidicapsa dinghuensis]